MKIASKTFPECFAGVENNELYFLYLERKNTAFKVLTLNKKKIEHPVTLNGRPYLRLAKLIFLPF